MFRKAFSLFETKNLNNIDSSDDKTISTTWDKYCNQLSKEREVDNYYNEFVGGSHYEQQQKLDLIRNGDGANLLKQSTKN